MQDYSAILISFFSDVYIITVNTYFLSQITPESIFKVLTKKQADVSISNQQLENYMTLLETNSATEQALKKQQIPKIYMTQVVKLEKPMVNIY